MDCTGTGTGGPAPDEDGEAAASDSNCLRLRTEDANAFRSERRCALTLDHNAQFAEKRGDDRVFQERAYLSTENGISSIEQSSVNRGPRMS